MRTHEPTTGELSSTYNIIQQVLAVHRGENDRLQEMSDALRESMGIIEAGRTYDSGELDHPRSDGIRIHHDTPRRVPCSVFFTLRNQTDEDDNDPVFQVEDDYAAAYLADWEQVLSSISSYSFHTNFSLVGISHSHKDSLPSFPRLHGWSAHQCQRGYIYGGTHQSTPH